VSSDFQQRLQRAIDADFLLERELGGGGMSRVFLATERALQRRVVIKVLPPDLAAGVNVERFRREIQLAAQLQHPHIVPLLATGDEDGILWFSMPFIEGESLRGALTKQKRLPARDVIRILHDVVDALAYAHARGVVHRDIKPDNILTSGMHALVTDFGVAKALSAAIPMAGGTTTGMAIGTPAYMAPEQLAADPAADHRVDIYAVGLLAYELITGRSPFSGSSPQATMAAQLTETPKPPHQFADIPEALSAIIMRCLEKDSAKRPQSAHALLADLDALPPMSSGSIPRPAPARRRTATRAMGALALLAVTVVVAQQVLRRNRATVESAADSLTARDIGPGGDRAGTAQLAAGPPSTSSVARPETVVVYRNNSDSESGIQVPVVISRAESLAIADAVRKRLATTPKPDSARAAGQAALASGAAKKAQTAAEAAQTAGTTANETRIVVSADGKTITMDRLQLAEEIGKIFADSVASSLSRMDTAFKRASRVYQFESAVPSGRVMPLVAPPSDGRVRIVVSNYTNATGKREMSSVSRDIAQYLRAGLPTETYDIVSTDLLERAARYGMNDPISLGFSLRADYVVSGLVMQRADSVVVVTQFRDVRDGRFSRAQEATASVSDPRKAYDASLAMVNGWLDTVKVLRARRPSMPMRVPNGLQGSRGAPRGLPPDGPPDLPKDARLEPSAR
jgi:eukaryotic-like serine/threonine-protein kinase